MTELLQYRTNSAYSQKTSHRAARDTPIEGFRFDRSTDMLGAVRGKSLDSALATQLSGGRSLRFKKKIATLDDLHDLAGIVLAARASTTYREQFGWVDNYVLIDDPVVHEQLRQALLDLLIATPDEVDMLVPDDLVEPDTTG